MGMPKIFICYRREDTQWPAQLINDSLEDHFGSESVVFDVNTPPGVDLRQYIRTMISECDVMLTLIGNRWLSILTERPQRSNDYVLIELETALEREISILPVLVDGTPMPKEEDLPLSLSPLVYISATDVRQGPDLKLHLERLIKSIEYIYQYQSSEYHKKDYIDNIKVHRTKDKRTNPIPSLDEKDWSEIVHQIRNRYSILVLGPDAVFDPDDANGTPLEDLLATQLSNNLSSTSPVNPEVSFYQIAQRFQQERDSRIDLEDAVEHFYLPFAGRTSNLHRYLARLPFSLCLSTTFDTYLTHAFLEARKKPQEAFYNYRTGRTPVVLNPTPNRPFVYNLFGSLSDPDSLVLTETDLQDFHKNVGRATTCIPPYISSRLSNHQNPILFVGFGFHRPYAQFLVGSLLKSNQYHYDFALALEDSVSSKYSDHTRMMTSYQQYPIQFFQHSLCDFAKELHDRYEENEQKRG